MSLALVKNMHAMLPTSVCHTIHFQNSRLRTIVATNNICACDPSYMSVYHGAAYNATASRVSQQHYCTIHTPLQKLASEKISMQKEIIYVYVATDCACEDVIKACVYGGAIGILLVLLSGM